MSPRRTVDFKLLSLPITDTALVVLDTETTGLFPLTGHRIVEIGAVRLVPDGRGGWVETSQFQTLLNPGRVIEPEASRVNGIFNQDLVGAPSFAEIAQELQRFLDSAVLVAHNARFDADFLGVEFYINSLTGGTGPDSLPAPHWLCTMELARRQFGFYRYNLAYVASQFSIRREGAHRALADVQTTARVFSKMVDELADFGLATVGDFVAGQGGAIQMPRIQPVPLPEPINTALARSLPLFIHYEGLYGETERQIELLYATEYQGIVYLTAHCHLRGDQRTFRLDRVLSAQILYQ